MTLFSRNIVLLLALSVTGCTNIVRPNFSQTLTELRSGAYILDKEHAYLNFKVEHLGLSFVVGRFNRMDATLDFEPQSISDLVLEGVIETDSIDMNNADLDERLKGSGWLNTEQFPQAIFKSTAVESAQGNSFVLNGEFTLRGVSQPVSLLGTFRGGADNLLTGKYTLGFTATGSISRADFGIDSFGALVGDEIQIEIHAEFQRQS